MRVVGNGVIPDLRFMSAETHSEFNAIVLGGARSDRGMVGFADQVSAEEAAAIHDFVISRANDDWDQR